MGVSDKGAVDRREFLKGIAAGAVTASGNTAAFTDPGDPAARRFFKVEP